MTCVAVSEGIRQSCVYVCLNITFVQPISLLHLVPGRVCWLDVLMQSPLIFSISPPYLWARFTQAEACMSCSDM